MGFRDRKNEREAAMKRYEKASRRYDKARQGRAGWMECNEENIAIVRDRRRAFDALSKRDQISALTKRSKRR